MDHEQNLEPKPDEYESGIIRQRVARMLGDQEIEEFIGEKYSRDVTECLNIVDIDYPVTALGILGRALEVCIKEYCQKKLKRKTDFDINGANLPISRFRKTINEANHKNRIKLLNQQAVILSGNNYRLKKKLIKDEIYWLLDTIRDARNDAFHGCDEEKYRELSAKGYSLIEQGIVLLVSLVKSINEEG